MEIEFYQAFVNLGLKPEQARNAVDSLKKEIDQRYATHAAALVTQKDLDAAVARIGSEIREATAKNLEAINRVMIFLFGSMVAIAGFTLSAFKFL